MSVQYGAIGWNRQKKIYDAVFVVLLVLYLALFVGLGALLNPNATAETLLIRGFGTAAYLCLNVVLCIGPLARLDRRFLPLLYNRRHLGVTTFLLGLAHGGFALFQFHALGNKNPLVSLFVSNPQYGSIAQFPFHSLGFFALVILFLMAATSHDFWLRNLSAPAWKRLHMLVYAAYTLLVAHIALGALQSETSPLLAAVLIAGLTIVVSLHLAAAFQERRMDRVKLQAAADGFVEVCRVDRISEKCATIVSVSGERVAVFRYDDKVSAVSNVCQHQNGPLGEGRIIDGCITCPWHGYQYLPATGASPAPFQEKVPTFQVKVVDGSVFVHPQPNAPGTFVEPASIDVEGVRAPSSDFYLGYAAQAPPQLARFVQKTVFGLALLIAAVALLLLRGQQPFANSTFEYGKITSLEGTILKSPYPTLLVASPQTDGRTLQYLLVAPGKHGAEPLVAEFDNQQVHLRGTLIYRDGATMVEVVPGSITIAAFSRPSGESARDLGAMSATGEIVDSKCYLGVMNPGQGKVHRDCAARCLSGGIPPIFITTRVIRDDAAPAPSHDQFLLVGQDGRAITPDALREFVAEPITVRGELMQQGDTKFLRISLHSLRHSSSSLF
jgi:nitrite reductase/ring-hydroxylating ferredoxin subunit/DMSO/TMAO reductase YedYZ heme-binding membrane subunit